VHIHLTDQFQQRKSPVHSLDVRTKLIVTLLFILTTSLIPFGAFAVYTLLLLLIVVATLRSQVGLGWAWRRSLLALPFALAAISLPFTVPGTALVMVPVFGGVVISLEGTVRFASILVKSWISVQAAVLLVAVTPFPELMWGLHALRVPQPLVAIVSFMYRYLFVLLDEAIRLMRARSARSASLPGRRSGSTVLWRGRVTGRMAGSLMLRSLERSERIYQAMIARGYRGQMKRLLTPKMKRGDYLTIAASAALLAALVLVSHVGR
jgi:cobalt/nickel transport system permease protein